jgi:hypothetical protein
MQNAEDPDSFSDLDASMPEDTGGGGSAFDAPPVPLPLRPAPAAAAAVADPQAFETISPMRIEPPRKAIQFSFQFSF